MRYPSCKKKQSGSPREIRRLKQKGFEVKEVQDMFNYYYQVAEYILPYLKDRPLSLNRFPGGIKGPSFYQKDVDVEKSPKWISSF